MRTLLSLLLPASVLFGCASEPVPAPLLVSSATPSLASRLGGLAEAGTQTDDGYVSIDVADYPELVAGSGEVAALAQGQTALVELMVLNDAHKTVIGEVWSTTLQELGRVNLPPHIEPGTLRLEAVFSQTLSGLQGKARVLAPLAMPFAEPEPCFEEQIITEVKALPIYVPEKVVPVDETPNPPDFEPNQVARSILSELWSLDAARGLGGAEANEARRNKLLGWTYAGYLELVRGSDGDIVTEEFHLLPEFRRDSFLPEVFVVADHCVAGTEECIRPLPVHASTDWIHLNGTGGAHWPGPPMDARWSLLRGQRLSQDGVVDFATTFTGTFELRSPAADAPRVAGWYGAPTSLCMRATSVTEPSCDTLTIEMKDSYLIFSLDSNTPLTDPLPDDLPGPELVSLDPDVEDGADTPDGPDGPDITVEGEMVDHILFRSSDLTVTADDEDGVASLRLKIGSQRYDLYGGGVVRLDPADFIAGATYPIEVTAIDGLGRAAVAQSSFRVDKQAPIVDIFVSKVEGTDQIAVVGQVTDDLELASVQLYVDGREQRGHWEDDWTFYWPVSEVVSGDHVIRVVATDLVLNRSMKDIPVVVDHIPRFIGGKSPAPFTVASGLVELAALADDDDEGWSIDYTVDGVAVPEVGGVATWDSCGVDLSTIIAVATVTDSAGQFTSQSWAFDVDNTDQDGDGQRACDGDCLDSDATVFLGATEITGDDIDQDCDGVAPSRSVAELVDGQLVITEVMVDPATGANDFCQWMEIFNNSPYQVDLRGLIVSAGKSEVKGRVTTSTLLSAGEVAVLARGSAKSFAGSCPELNSKMVIDAFCGFGLPSPGGEQTVRLEGGRDGQINEITVSGAWGGTMHLNADVFDRTLGPGSLAADANSDPNAWCDSTTLLVTDSVDSTLEDYGTPGVFVGDTCP